MNRKKQGLILIILLVSIFIPGCGTRPEKETAGDFHSEELCEITIENVILAGKNESLSQIEALVNEITVPAIGCRVRLIDCPIAEHEALMKKIQAGIEQVDLVETGLTTSLSALVSSGTLLLLETLLEEHGKELKEKEGRLLQATAIDGHIYAIPANLYCGRAEGIGYNADAALQYGIRFQYNLHCTFSDFHLSHSFRFGYNLFYKTTNPKKVSIMHFGFSYVVLQFMAGTHSCSWQRSFLDPVTSGSTCSIRKKFL